MLDYQFFGKYRGEVVDNDDPTLRGRIKVFVPAVLGTLEAWAMPCVPYAGQGSGLYTLPKPGTQVWVEFEGGDPAYAIWSGCFWLDVGVPAGPGGKTGQASLKILRSEQGLMVALDDDSQMITISDDSGSNLLEIGVTKGQLTLKASGKIVLSANDIELVEGAAHPLVYGDALLQYLNQLVALYQSHIHPGQLAGDIEVTPAPPVPPFQPALPGMLSFKVKAA